MYPNTEILPEFNLAIRIANLNWEQTQVLSGQQIILMLRPHKRNNVNGIDTNPLCT